MKKEITHDELDEICDRFDNMEFKCGNWWPTIEEINKHFTKNIKQNLEFMIWITETASEPKTDEERASKKKLLSIINHNISFKEDKEDKEIKKDKNYSREDT